MEKCLKALQERKLVLLCVRNSKTKSNEAAMQGVRDFEVDARFAQVTEVIPLDSHDPAEAQFLRKLQVDPKSDEATTVFLGPPGAIIGTFKGATDKDTLVSTLVFCNLNVFTMRGVFQDVF
jgi:hypothetical protein